MPKGLTMLRAHRGPEERRNPCRSPQPSVRAGRVFGRTWLVLVSMVSNCFTACLPACLPAWAHKRCVVAVRDRRRAVWFTARQARDTIAPATSRRRLIIHGVARDAPRRQSTEQRFTPPVTHSCIEEQNSLLPRPLVSFEQNDRQSQSDSSISSRSLFATFRKKQDRNVLSC